tara:strand:+ start:964 stop:1215 length:252 start_codon:yes stop_codon:yes gene_type:complete
MVGGLVNQEGGRPELPVIDGIEIINPNKKWTICKRDELGKFFVIQKASDVTQAESILQLKDNLVTVESDPKLMAFLKKETQYH